MHLSAEWLTQLRFDPLPALMRAGDPALGYFVRRDLLGEMPGRIQDLWELPAAERLLRKQSATGAWLYPGKREPDPSGTNYALVESFRTLRALVEQYGFDRQHPVIEKAAGFIFSCQTAEGDLRGILGNQYMPYYHGAILELLVKAGYGDHANVRRGLDWLLQVRQIDGGWMIPAQAVPAKDKNADFWRGMTLPFDPQLPSCHLATGMALRALAAHPSYRLRPETQQAGVWLAQRLFKKDSYNDRSAPAYWFKFQYPFWWTTLLTVMDTLGLLGLSARSPEVLSGLAWFRDHQQPDGLWTSAYTNPKDASQRLWIGLAICRAWRRYSAQE